MTQLNVLALCQTSDMNRFSNTASRSFPHLIEEDGSRGFRMAFRPGDLLDEDLCAEFRAMLLENPSALTALLDKASDLDPGSVKVIRITLQPGRSSIRPADLSGTTAWLDRFLDGWIPA